jgi:hypothetical protein
MALGASAGLRAQAPRLTSRVPDAVRTAVEPILDSARDAGLPITPLEEKMLEGVTKQADASRIAMAVRRLATDLTTARSALGDRATVRQLVAGAGALRAGLTPHDLTEARVARPKGDPAVALEVATDLITQGVPSDTAARVVLSVLGAGASDGELEQLRAAVEREITAGVPGGVAASIQARALTGSTMPQPVSPQPPR